jgi:putative ABC transport system permease protein
MINVDWSIVSADYFETMQLPLLKGRAFTKQESDEGKPVVIIDERLAQRFWPNEEAIGKHLKYDSPVWHEIVGVAKNVNIYGSESQPIIKIYTPLGRFPQRQSVLSIRTSAEPQALTAAIAREIQNLDKDLPVGETATLEALLAREVATRRFNTWLFVLLGTLALILAVSGVYSVISYSVAQRTHEVGIRVALGAGPSQVLKLFIGQGMRMVMIGLAVGLVSAMFLSQLLTALLFGVRPIDLTTFGLVSICLIGVALLACYIPARRATKVDPLVALRYE